MADWQNKKGSGKKSDATKARIELKKLGSLIKELTGKKNYELETCSYKAKRSGNQRAIILECKTCKFGGSSITNERCRENIFKILIVEPKVDRLVLSHLYERDYEMENLDFLYQLAWFIEGINIYKEVYVDQDSKIYLSTIIKTCSHDPIKAYIDILTLRKSLNVTKNKVVKILEKIISTVPEFAQRIKDETDSGYYYNEVIKSLVRPRFSSSRIYTAPPKNTEFLEGYEVQRPGGRVMPITIYKLTDRPECLYFAIPPEYNLKPEELEL